MNVLVVEDEPRLAELIARTLKRELIDTTIQEDGLEALDDASSGEYDVIVLDRMLPSKDGLSVLQELRRRRVTTPVLMLTALGDVPDRVAGLSAGADDYLGKPFSFDELIARVRALGRRVDKLVVDERHQIGQISIDLLRREVWKEGQPIELTPREYALLETLVRHKGQALSRDQLLRRVWGAAADHSENIVDLYVHYLRKKIDPASGDDPSIIRTVRGFGYTIG